MDGMRTVALKLEFGVTRNQIFERFVVFPFSPYFSPGCGGRRIIYLIHFYGILTLI